ncbi:MAG TPA: DUF5677 domain-containing protein [Terriglobales bacterium]|nr:DUF5677 domain-containing protein [Terriglobales bacterium]
MPRLRRREILRAAVETLCRLTLMAYPSIKNEMRNVKAYLRGAEAEVNRLGILPRLPYRHPFDILSLAIVSKVFTLSKACLTLLASGFPDEAFGLSRSIVECATNLRFLTAEPAVQYRRSRDFAKFARADKAFWAHYALEHANAKERELQIRQYMEREGIVADTKPLRRHWSGEDGFVWKVATSDHPLDGAMTEKHRKAEYAVNYSNASAFVHCSSPAIDSYCPNEEVPFRISSSSGLRKTGRWTLFVIVISVHSSIGYALFGMNIDSPTRLDTLYLKTVEKLL